MTEHSHAGVLQNIMQLSSSQAVSLDITRETQPSLSSAVLLPPRTPDERSRELCAQSTLLVWRARRACVVSQQLRAQSLSGHRNTGGACPPVLCSPLPPSAPQPT